MRRPRGATVRRRGMAFVVTVTVVFLTVFAIGFGTGFGVGFEVGFGLGFETGFGVVLKIGFSVFSGTVGRAGTAERGRFGTKSMYLGII